MFFFFIIVRIDYLLGEGRFLKRKTIRSSPSFFSTSFFFDRNVRISERLSTLHDEYIITWLVGICIIVFFLIYRLYTVLESRKKFTSRALVEVLWIVVPFFVLLWIGLPSIFFLYKLEESFSLNSLCFKRCGYQWFWTYENLKLMEKNRISEVLERYINRRDEDFLFNYINSSRRVKIPTFFSIKNLITSRDVIHRWTLPSLMLKSDAIPGRINAIELETNNLTNFKYYGQCSELCGANHSFIPIVLETKF